MSTEEQNGGSFMSELKRYYRGLIMALKGVRTNFKPVVRKILKEYGDKQITSLSVVRTPLKSVYQFFVKEANKRADLRDISHDQLFHLFLVVSVGDGNEWVIEKNENINIKKYSPKELDERRHIENVEEDLSMNILLGRTLEKVGVERFYHYDAFDTNCQRFVMDVLESNNINVSDDLREFIMQNVSNMVPSWIERVVQIATDIANRGETIIEGEGKKKKIYKRRTTKRKTTMAHKKAPTDKIMRQYIQEIVGSY